MEGETEAADHCRDKRVRGSSSYGARRMEWATTKSLSMAVRDEEAGSTMMTLGREGSIPMTKVIAAHFIHVFVVAVTHLDCSSLYMIHLISAPMKYLISLNYQAIDRKTQEARHKKELDQQTIKVFSGIP